MSTRGIVDLRPHRAHWDGIAGIIPELHIRIIHAFLKFPRSSGKTDLRTKEGPHYQVRTWLIFHCCVRMEFSSVLPKTGACSSTYVVAISTCWCEVYKPPDPVTAGGKSYSAPNVVTWLNW